MRRREDPFLKSVLKGSRLMNVNNAGMSTIARLSLLTMRRCRNDSDIVTRILHPPRGGKNGVLSSVGDGKISVNRLLCSIS